MGNIPAMTRFQVEATIMDCLTKRLQENSDIPPSLSLESSLMKDLGMDSLEIMEFVLDLEKEFNISLDVIDPVDKTQIIGQEVISSGDLCVKHLADVICQKKLLILDSEGVLASIMV